MINASHYYGVHYGIVASGYLFAKHDADRLDFGEARGG